MEGLRGKEGSGEGELEIRLGAIFVSHPFRFHLMSSISALWTLTVVSHK